MTQLPPEDEWNTTPAGQPPPGVKCCNFANPESRGYVLVTVCSILLAFMLFFWSARLYSKMFLGKAKLMWDDFTCSFAAILGIVVFGIQVWGVTAGPIGKHIWDVPLSATMTDIVLIVSTC